MKNKKDRFDYIIIGGGSAGCVLANRLSTDPKNEVCLLEAGPRDSNPFIKIPLGISICLLSKKINWRYWTEKQKNCANRAMYWPRGRTLGGSSAINAMCYVRGNPLDYDEWAELGCEGWSYQEVLPYFKKMENFAEGPSPDHGVGGPMTVSTYRYLNPITKAFVKAGEQLNYPLLKDYNTGSQEGVGYFYVAQENGQRCSNAHAYLEPIKNRKNLTIMTNAQVTKILFQDKRAVGIEYCNNKIIKKLYANKEIILAAGAIGSPQLLMLSGVGPKQEIEKNNIPLVQDLPGVGENLQDHLDIHITCLEKTKASISFKPNFLKRIIRGSYDYFFNRCGEFTSNYTQATGFIKSEESLPKPDLQWHFAASVYTNSALELGDMFKYNGYTLMVCHLNPKSRGRITLRDNNPFSYPLIDANYLAEKTDLDTLVIGFKKSREILAQSAFNPYFLREYQPGPEVKTDEEIKDYIRKYAETIYHPVGTCKMGIDKMSVVDPKTLKVYGLENVRVIDASIMPVLITGNTNAPTTMIAEKGADFILNSL